MDIEDFRKLVNASGNVPMQITRPFMPYQLHQVAGFPPEVAKSYHDAGVAEVYKVPRAPEKDPMLGHTGPAPGSHAAAAVAHGHVLVDRTTIYDGRPEITPRAQTAPATVQDPTARPAPADRIPEGWEEFDGAKKRKLAADLSGKRYQEISADEATVIIQAAIDGEPAPPTTSDQNVIVGGQQPTV